MCSTLTTAEELQCNLFYLIYVYFLRAVIFPAAGQWDNPGRALSSVKRVSFWNRVPGAPLHRAGPLTHRLTHGDLRTPDPQSSRQISFMATMSSFTNGWCFLPSTTSSKLSSSLSMLQESAGRTQRSAHTWAVSWACKRWQLTWLQP